MINRPNTICAFAASPRPIITNLLSHEHFRPITPPPPRPPSTTNIFASHTKTIPNTVRWCTGATCPVHRVSPCCRRRKRIPAVLSSRPARRRPAPERRWSSSAAPLRQRRQGGSRRKRRRQWLRQRLQQQIWCIRKSRAPFHVVCVCVSCVRVCVLITGFPFFLCAIREYKFQLPFLNCVKYLFGHM